MKKNVKDRIIELTLILVGAIIVYQLLKKILGGSWQTESLIIALIIFNLVLTLRIHAKLEGHIGWHKGKGD